MLSKLAIRNVKRSFKDYAIYLITITLAFAFMFAFNLITTSEGVLNLSEVMSNFEFAMYFVNAFVLVAVCFLINYTTKFMFEKRSREFGTYMILGIKKREISKIFTLENIILGFLSLLISIPIGYLFSLIMSFVIMNIFELPELVKISFNLKAVFLLFLYFGIIYLIVLFLLRRRLKKMRINKLIHLEKQNEKVKHNKLSRNLIFIVSILLGVFALYLFDKQFIGVGHEPSFQLIVLSIFLLLISIYGISITLLEFILNFVLKHKKLKYKNDNLFIMRNLFSKIKTMSFTIGTLSFLITLALVALNISSLFKGMFLYQIEYNAPYDISISVDENLDEYLNFIEDNYTILEKVVYNDYKNYNNSILKFLELSWREEERVITLSDFNKLLEMKGDKPITLNEDEYYLNVTKEFIDELKNADIKDITLSNGITLKQKDITDEGYTLAWGVGYGYVLVVPDSAVKNLDINSTHLSVNTKEKTTEEFAKKLVEFADPDFCQENEYGYKTCYSLANITVRGEEKANNKGFLTITAFVCFYVAFIFTAIVGTILAIQALSDSNKYKYRYQVLSKLGVSDEKLYKTIFKQLLIFYVFPIIYPIIVSICTIKSMNNIFQIALSTNTVYLKYFSMNLILFLIPFVIYFIATYFGFKNNIKS